VVLTMQAIKIINDAAQELQDQEHVRWPVKELAGYVSDGQRFILNKVPSATAVERELTLAAGVRQQIPDDARALLQVIRNVDGRQRAIRQVARDLLDACSPGWASGRQRQAVIHFIIDERTPRLFDVFPPIEAGVKVLASIALEPVAIADTGLTDLTVDDEYAEALFHYALFRAYSKDAEHASILPLATAHQQLFTDALGINTGRPMTADDPTT
jgi:hypothetical protein